MRWTFSIFSNISDGNFRPVRSFPINLPLHRMEIFEVSKFSDYIPFTQDGNFRLVRSFPIRFSFLKMEIPNVSKFSDYISIAKDGNRRLFEDFWLYSLFKGWKYPTIRWFEDSKFSADIPYQRKEITEFYGKKRLQAIRVLNNFTMHIGTEL